MSVQSGTSPGAITSSGVTAAPGGVTSVFGRTGAVVAVTGDYDSDLVDNASTVPGATVSDALESLAAAAVPLSAVAPVDVTKSAAVVGVGTSAARSDHKHDITTAAAVTISTTNTEGVATTLARSDHTHIGAASVFGRTGAVVAVSGDYTSTLVTNSSTVVGATVTAALDTLNTGKAALTAIAPVNVTKAAAAVGVGTTAARNDHKHDIDTAAAVTISTTNTEGTATSLARSDHTHIGAASVFGRTGAVVAVSGDYTSTLVTNSSTVTGATVTAALDTLNTGKAALTAIAPVNVTKAAAAVGVGTTAARNDHKHDIDTAVVVATGAANAEGTATSLARSDHVHLTTPVMWTWANATARLAQAVTAAQVGAIGYQTDINLKYEALSTTPTWGQLPASYKSGLDRQLLGAASLSSIATIALSMTQSSGGVAAANPTSTNKATALFRSIVNTAAPAGSFFGYRMNGNVGPVSGQGFICSTVFTLDAVCASLRWLVCFIVTPFNSNLDPATLTSFFGVGRGAAEANVQFYNNDAAGSATKTDLGAAFPANTINTGFQLDIYTKDGTTIAYQLTNINTGVAVSGTVNSNIPVTNSVLTLMYYGSNNTDATAIAMGIGSAAIANIVVS